MNVCPAIHTLIYRIVYAFIEEEEEEEEKDGIGVALRRLRD